MDVDKQRLIASIGGKLGAKVNKEKQSGMYAFSFEDRSRYSSEHNKERIWITDGSVDRRIKLTEDIPDGFYKGRSQVDMTNSRVNLLCWTNGKINVFAETPPSEEFSQGMVKTTPTAYLPWWNDGVVNKRAENSPGPDFVPGRLKWKSKLVRCPHCEKSGGETAMKRHHFDNCKLKGSSND